MPPGHPLRLIRRIADAVLAGMSQQFAAAYAPIGRPSIAPEKLPRALLLQAPYTIRPERQLVDRIAFDLLFRPPRSPDLGSCGDGSAASCG